MKILLSVATIATNQGICRMPAFLSRQKRIRITSQSPSPNDGLLALHLQLWIMNPIALKMKVAM